MSNSRFGMPGGKHPHPTNLRHLPPRPVQTVTAYHVDGEVPDVMPEVGESVQLILEASDQPGTFAQFKLDVTGTHPNGSVTGQIVPAARFNDKMQPLQPLLAWDPCRNVPYSRTIRHATWRRTTEAAAQRAALAEVIAAKAELGSQEQPAVNAALERGLYVTPLPGPTVAEQAAAPDGYYGADDAAASVDLPASDNVEAPPIC